MQYKHPYLNQQISIYLLCRKDHTSEEKNNLPNLESLRCFKINSEFGITYRTNVWHHPLLVLKKQDFWIVDRINNKERNNENLVEFYFNENDYAYINLNT